MKTEPTMNELLQFLARAGAKGWINPTTAASLKSTTKRLGEVMDELELSDAIAVDADGLIRRFGNLNPDMSPGSLRTYLARFKRAVSMFESYREDPLNWQPPASTGAKREKKNNTPPARTTKKQDASGRRSESKIFHSQPSQSGFNYPFPLRPDSTIMISGLPRDLKTIEVERIAAFLRSLAEDFSP